MLKQPSSSTITAHKPVRPLLPYAGSGGQRPPAIPLVSAPYNEEPGKARTFLTYRRLVSGSTRPEGIQHRYHDGQRFCLRLSRAHQQDQRNTKALLKSEGM